MGDWADEKAREWLTHTFGPEGKKKHDPMVLSSLATLLREVVKQKQYEQWQTDQHVTAEELTKQIAEVRRVVKAVRDQWERSESPNTPAPPDDITRACTEILLRLGKLGQ